MGMLLRRSHVQDTNKMKLHVDVLTPRCATWVVLDRFRALIVAENICSHPGQLRLQEYQHSSHKERLLVCITQGNVLGFIRGSRNTFLRRALLANGCVPQHHCHSKHGLLIIRCRRVISISKHSNLQARTTNKPQTYLFRRIRVRGDLQ